MSTRLTIKEILAKTTAHFKKYELQTPRLDAEVLLADLLGMERIELYVNFDRPLETEEVDQYRKRVIQRSKRIPVAYIIGYQEFMSLEFKVNDQVLIPRPETEHLVETALEKIESLTKESLQVVELCTGSGAVVISLAKQLGELAVTKEIDYVATDISKSALEIAQENASKHGVLEWIEFLSGDLLVPLEDLANKADLLLANPPYIATEEWEQLQPEVKREPELALKAGEDGLEFYRRIISGAESVIAEQGLLGLEIGLGQAEAVQKLLLDKGFIEVEVIDDYAEIPRVIFAKKSS
ncbi:peptide chain release factor N(5)-glutamine methyltransferase [Fuchsiella alkaliacetigena]|uniref:peptide chain release factor N(5)-glutamine methyltransferase n=1 Tax=Fuchsiella alkaliacetigena TaxID=957042 RepID=UPI00200A7E37|nr:peptide chain release factor N(5)-glutamine methyltransferase [Fuchsiella alkaliacetigena]